MVKRILKIIGLVLAGFVVIAGAAVGITALTGGFNKEVVHITHLYFGEDKYDIEKFIYLNSDEITQNINFAPLNATEKDLTVSVLGNGETDNGGVEIIENITKITAGQEFKIKAKKDAKGNYVGGVVQIVAKTRLATVSITVVVDSAVPDNSMYFTGSQSGKLSTTGKSFIMPISQNTQYVYLKSNLVNAFYFPVGDENLRNVQIDYTYYLDDGGVRKGNLSNVAVAEDYLNAEQGIRNYQYRIPIVTNEAGVIELTAKMHRTSQIAKEFNEGGFDSLVSKLQAAQNTHSSFDDGIAYDAIGKYNNFLNKNIKYFDTSEESFDFFKHWLNKDGVIQFSIDNINEVKESLEYVYVSCKATINVTAIQLSDFTSVDKKLSSYKVFDQKVYSINGVDISSSSVVDNIVDDFGLSIAVDNENVSNIDKEKAYLFESLSVKPYLYLDVENNISQDSDVQISDDEKYLVMWADRTYNAIPVYGFDSGNLNRPYTTPGEDRDTIIGYLLQLQDSDEYLSVSEFTINGEKHWKVTCNTPLPVEQSDSVPTKALYLGFQVSGLANDNRSMITIETYSRVFIDYVDYPQDGQGMQNLKFTFDDDVNPVPIKDMTINTSITDVSGGNLDSQNPTKQHISLVKNYSNDVTYTSVMYFVEHTSNVVGSGSKIVATGRYKFVSLTHALYPGAVLGDDPYATLVGERIPTCDVNGYYIQALNASPEPVRLFAVAYLCNKDGLPIDANGRVMKNIDETNPGADEKTWPKLIVVRMTEYDINKMVAINIHSYVDEVNFYTKSLINHTVEGVDFLKDTMIYRNVLSGYQAADGTPFDTDQVNALNDFLQLKLLKNNYFTLYVSPFRLDGDNNSTDTYVYESFKNVYGQMLQEPCSFKIETENNKQLAFNTLCANFGGENGAFELVIQNNSNIQIIETAFEINDGEYVSTYTPSNGGADEVENVSKIRFILHATENSNGSQTNTNGSTTATIKLMPTNLETPSVPYSSVMFGEKVIGNMGWNNYVTCQVNSLEIYNVELSNDYEMRKTLFARYANIDPEKDKDKQGSLDFMEITSDKQNGGIVSNNYFLTLDNGHVKYSVENNLMQGTEFNLSLVDSSQAGERTFESITQIDEEYCPTTIEDYINKFVVGDNGTGISYNNADTVMTFMRDCTFSNAYVSANSQVEYSNEFIHFGTKKFEFNDAEQVVNINGYKLPLTKQEIAASENSSGGTQYSFTINKGEYFPVVKGNQAIIYNEIFTIYDDDNNGKYIMDYVEVGRQEGNSVAVSLTGNIVRPNGEVISYEASTYLSDTDIYNNSAITPIETGSDSTPAVQARINFKQGEETASVVEDAKGNYKFENDKYVLAESGYKGTRYSLMAYQKNVNGNLYLNNGKYEAIRSQIDVNDRWSKRGVIVHLLITFNVIKTSEGHKYTFYKVITYELIQEEINIIGVNKTVDGVDQYNQQFSSELSIDAGTNMDANTISLRGSDGARITTSAYYEEFFFNHVKFSMVGTNLVSWEICKDAQGIVSAIKLKTPNLIEEGSLTLRLTYSYKGQDKIYSYYITIKPNVEFAANNNTDIVSGEDGTTVYKISLGSGTKPIFWQNGEGDSYFINKHFTIGENVKYVTLTVDNGYQNYAVISGNDITIYPSYATYEDNTIVRDYVICTITLKLTDDSEIVLNNKLYIEIIPTYIVDLTQVDNGITIFNNESIYVNYVKLYDNDTQATNITNNNANPITDISAYSMFEMEFVEFKTNPDNYSSSNITFENGRIKLSSTPTRDTTFSVKISYTEGGSTVYKIATITIIGIAQQYNLTGSEVTVEDNNITITLDNLSDFYSKINDYFEFSRATGENDIQALLVKDGVSVTTLEYGTTYEVWYGKASGTGQGFTPIEATAYTVTFAMPVQSE